MEKQKAKARQRKVGKQRNSCPQLHHKLRSRLRIPVSLFYFLVLEIVNVWRQVQFEAFISQKLWRWFKLWALVFVKQFPKVFVGLKICLPNMTMDFEKLQQDIVNYDCTDEVTYVCPLWPDFDCWVSLQFQVGIWILQYRHMSSNLHWNFFLE